MLAGEGWVGRAGDADGRRFGLEDPQRLGQGVAALGVQDDVVAVGDLLEVLGSVVDDDLGTQVTDPFQVAGAGRGGGDGRPQVLGQLDGGGADPPEPAWTSTLWPGCRFARSTRACQAVRATRGTEAAWAMERLAGLIARSSWSTARRSAKVPMRPSRPRP